jgi:hypothetical protein
MFTRISLSLWKKSVMILAFAAQQFFSEKFKEPSLFTAAYNLDASAICTPV